VKLGAGEEADGGFAVVVDDDEGCGDEEETIDEGAGDGVSRCQGEGKRVKIGKTRGILYCGDWQQEVTPTAAHCRFHCRRFPPTSDTDSISISDDVHPCRFNSLSGATNPYPRLS